MQLAHYVIFQARLHPDEPAIGFAGGVVTYDLLVKGVAAALAQLGALELSRGDLVVLHLSNPFHHAALQLALLLSGQVSASIFARAQIEYSGVTPALVLTDREDFALTGARVIRIDGDWLRVDPARPPDYAALLALPGFRSQDDVAQVSFSSGTTGYPKAVGTRWGTIEAETFEGAMLHAGPHSHAVRCIAMTGAAGSTGLLLYVLSQGGFMALATQPDEVLRLVRAFDLEAIFGATGQLQSLIAALGSNAPPRSLRTMVGFGSKLSTSLLAQIQTRLCANFNVMYSSTEAGIMAFANGTLLAAHEGCAGYPAPGVRIEAVDANDVPVPAGEDGVIRVRTPYQSAYLRPTPETDAMFRDGWFYPGDVGRLDRHGLLYITGRVSEVINRGGVIVAPDMIEEALRQLPKVRDVAVFGVPDADGLDRIFAAVVSDEWVDEGGIRQVIASRLPDRTPDRIVQVEAIPRTETGKVRRAELRERFSKS